MKTKASVLAGVLLFAMMAGAITPRTVTLAWDYNLAENPDVNAFRLIHVESNGTRTNVLDVPLPSPLPAPGADGFATFTADVVPDKTGRWDFVCVALTAAPSIFSVDSNVATAIVKPDPPRNLR